MPQRGAGWTCACAAKAAAPTRSPTTPAATGTARSARASAARRWLEARQADLLPVEYYHVVFTLPAPIADIAYHNKAVIYGLLFDVAAETLLTIAADPKHLGAQHRRDAGAAHLGLGADASPACARHRARRRAGRRRRALGRLQAGLLPAGARALAAVPAALPRRARSRRIAPASCSSSASTPRWPTRRPSPDWLAPLRQCEWVVYAKRPFAGPEAVLAYLSRYTHRVAISNSRLLALDERGVTFRWKDYRAKGQHALQDDDARAPTSSCAASCCTCCPAASIASATTGCWPTAAASASLALARELLHVPAHRAPAGRATRSTTGGRPSSARTAATR